MPDRHAEEPGHHDWCPPLDRRAAVRLLGVGGLATLAGCGSSTTPTPISSSSGSSDTACGLTYEGEEGPYFVNDGAPGYRRSDVRTNLDGSNAQSGVALALTVVVLDVKRNCFPLQGAQVDIWSCNALGIYSGEVSQSTATESWLRGYQLTDGAGRVAFTTIVPGWYTGRTSHVHLRLRTAYDASASGSTNTTQLFFDPTLITSIYTTVAPYSSRGTNPLSNGVDRVYSQQEHATNVLALTGSVSSGYSASITLYVPLTTA